MPPAVRTFALAVLAAAVAAAVATTALVELPEVDTEVVGVLVALTLALVVAAALPVRPARGGSHTVTLEEAVLLAMLVTVPVAVLPWLVLLAVLLQQLHRRTPVTKAAFNVGVAGLGASAAVMEVRLLGGLVEDGGLAAELALASFGVVAAAIVQLVLFAVLLRLLHGGSLREHLELDGFLDVALLLNVVLGLVLATSILFEPWMALAVVALLVGLGGLLRERTDAVEPAAATTGPAA